MDNTIHPTFLLGNNILLHCLILFIILSILFKIIIVPLTVKHVNDEFLNIINKLVNPDIIKNILANKNSQSILTSQLKELLNINMNDPSQVLLLNELTKYIMNTPTEKIQSTFQLLANNYANYESELRVKTNSDLFKKLKIIIFLLIVIALIVNIFPKIFGNKNTQIKHLGLELLAIFAGVGLIEYWFFMNIGKKYIPVLPSVITDTFKTKMVSLINEPLAPTYIPTPLSS